MTHIIDVKTDFSPTPAGRLPIHGPNNGRRFRKQCLLKTLKKHDLVQVDFTGIRTVGASFLNEAIAGLVWHDGFTEADLRTRLEIIIPSDPSKVETAWAWVRQAEEKRTGDVPAGHPGGVVQMVAYI